MASPLVQDPPTNRAGECMIFKALATTLAATIAVAAPAQHYGAGRDPGWALFQELAEEAVNRELSDAQIGFPYQYVGGYWTDRSGRRHYGWWACGDARGIDAEGNRRGWSKFVVVVRDGEVVHSEVGRPRFTDYTRGACSNAVVARTMVPVAQARAAAQPARTAPRGMMFGIVYRATVQGAQLTGVTRNGPAARAGLRPGAVITHLNGIPLANVPQATLERLVLDAPVDSVLTINGRDMRLRKALYDPARGF